MVQAYEKYQDIYICGYMNFPDVNWDQINSGVRIDSTSVVNNKVNNFMNNHFMIQTVNQCTRNHNILDYVFTNSVHAISHDEIITNTYISDHNTVLTVRMGMGMGVY